LHGQICCHKQQNDAQTLKPHRPPSWGAVRGDWLGKPVKSILWLLPVGRKITGSLRAVTFVQGGGRPSYPSYNVSSWIKTVFPILLPTKDRMKAIATGIKASNWRASWNWPYRKVAHNKSGSRMADLRRNGFTFGQETPATTHQGASASAGSRNMRGRARGYRRFVQIRQSTRLLDGIMCCIAKRAVTCSASAPRVAVAKTRNLSCAVSSPANKTSRRAFS